MPDNTLTIQQLTDRSKQPPEMPASKPPRGSSFILDAEGHPKSAETGHDRRKIRLADHGPAENIPMPSARMQIYSNNMRILG